MLRSIKCKALKRFAETGDAAKLPVQKPDRVRRILVMLNAAVAPGQMDIAGFRYHPLQGAHKGRYAVWVSDNYRITFGWDGQDAIDVDLEDYH
jgi:proteic killer suppression protein